jgi:outer membrane protein OmpA-like peptidoglycan-associated protein
VTAPRTALVALVSFGLVPALLAGVPAVTNAQAAPALGGVEARVGLAFPERATVAPVITGEVDLGHVWRPALRVIAGLSHFRADIDREPGDDEGSFRATGVWLGGRYDLLALERTAAYVRAGLTLQSVSADAWDRDVGALLSGTYAGAGLAAGARQWLDRQGRLGATFEVRRAVLNNIGHTAVEIGLRLQPRGAFTYVPAGVVVAPAHPLHGVPPVRPPAGVPGETPPAAPGAVPPAMPRPGTPVPADTAAARQHAEALAEAAAAGARREAELAEQRARELAMAEQREAAVAAERAAAAEAVLRQGLNRAAAAMSSVVSMRETETEFIVTIAGNAFASGAATLSGAARGELRVLATVLAGYPGHITSVEGHTDAVGSAAANQALSVDRADAVRAALVVEGVDPLWTGARGFGQERPVATNDTAAGRASNRRVEIRIMRQPCAAPPRAGADGVLACPPAGGVSD